MCTCIGACQRGSLRHHNNISKKSLVVGLACAGIARVSPSPIVLSLTCLSASSLSHPLSRDRNARVGTPCPSKAQGLPPSQRSRQFVSMSTLARARPSVKTSLYVSGFNAKSGFGLEASACFIQPLTRPRSISIFPSTFAFKATNLHSTTSTRMPAVWRLSCAQQDLVEFV